MSKRPHRFTTAFVLSALIAGLALIVTTGQADAAPKPQSGTPVDCVNSPNSALQDAITNANSGDTLRITGTCIGQFEIAKNLTLAGNPATLDGDYGGTVLTVDDGYTVNVSKLTIQNGAIGSCTSCPNIGAGIRNAGVLTLSSVDVRYNDVGNCEGCANVGAGIVNTGVLTLSGSAVYDNDAGYCEYCLNAAGGILNFNSLTLTGSHVDDNSVNCYFGACINAGGGIVNIGASKLTSSTVSDNFVGNCEECANAGGGIANFGPLTLTTSSVSWNQIGYCDGCTNAGGGILNGIPESLLATVFGPSLVMNGSTVANNAISCAFCDGFGGGIANFEAPASLTNSTVSGNHIETFGPCSDSAGAGIYNEGGTLTLKGSFITGNNLNSDGGGGGIYNKNYHGDSGNEPGIVNINSSTISNNVATGGEGGGILNYGGTVNGSSVVISGNSASGDGGGIFNTDFDDYYNYIYDDGVVNLYTSKLMGNHAGGTSNGGGIANEYGADALLSSSTVSNNIANGLGGGIYTYCADTVATPKTKITLNSAPQVFNALCLEG